MDRDQRVCMAKNNASFGSVFSFSFARSHHDKVLSVSLWKKIEKFIRIFNCVVLNALWRYPHDVSGSKWWKSTLSPGVVSMELSPRFLEQAHPHLTLAARGKNWHSRFRVHRQVVVDHHRGQLPIDVELDQVNPGLVLCLGQKHGLDAEGLLCQGRERRKEVAVAKQALVYVIWFDAIKEYVTLRVNLTRSLPFQVLENLRVAFIVNLRVKKWPCFRRKVFIDPRIA